MREAQVASERDRAGSQVTCFISERSYESKCVEAGPGLKSVEDLLSTETLWEESVGSRKWLDLKELGLEVPKSC